MDPNPKQYGLILPGKQKQQAAAVRKFNPLCTSDDELEKDEETPMDWVEASLKKSAGNSGQQSLQKRLLREALEADASVFEYDEVYDDLQASRALQADTRRKASEKPKYIHNILKQAEKRKLEGERRQERKVQKEREAEGEEFADKEAYVTSSYLKKLEELKQAEEEEKRETLREENDQALQNKNQSIFYSHLFKQRVGGVTGEDGGLREKQYRSHRQLSESPERKEDQDVSVKIKVESGGESEPEDCKPDRFHDWRSKETDERRKEDDRKGKSDHSKSHGKDRVGSYSRRSRSREKGGHNSRVNSQRFGRKSRSRSHDRQEKHSHSAEKARKVTTESERKAKERDSNCKGNSREKSDVANDGKKKENLKEKVTEKVKMEQEAEAKEKRLDRIRNLFAKRTVGAKLDEALKRYYLRKSEREASG